MSGRSGDVSEGEGSAHDEEGHGARAAALVLPSLRGDAVGAFREVNLTILRMILITSTHNLNDADFLREQNMTGTDVMNVLEDIILHGIEK